MGMGYVKIVYGCNRLEDVNFVGVYRCQYATKEQIDIEELRKELRKDE